MFYKVCLIKSNCAKPRELSRFSRECTDCSFTSFAMSGEKKPLRLSLRRKGCAMEARTAERQKIVSIKIIIEIFEICGAISHKPKTFSIFAMSSKGDGHIDESVWLLSCTGNLVNSKKEQGIRHSLFTLYHCELSSDNRIYGCGVLRGLSVS